MKLEQVLIHSGTTIRDAMKVIESGTIKIAIVADEERHLKGVVSDGDIRRGLLNGVSLDEAVSEVMNRSPIVRGPDTSQAEILELMRQKGTIAIPVVVDDRVVDVRSIYSRDHAADADNAVFLMAGGFGTRLKHLTEECPKPLLRVGGKPILKLIIEGFAQSGFSRFFVSTHYRSEMIRDYFGDGSALGVDIQYVHEYTPLGTAGALGLLPKDEIQSPFIMMNGDLLTTLNFRNLLDFHLASDAIATICVSNYEYQVPYGVVERDGERVVAIREKPTYQHFVNAGIYVLSEQLLQEVTAGEPLDMPQLIEKQLGSRRPVTTFPIHEYWLDVGRLEDFERAQRDIISL
jgi:dTDP-glucose pyrophosphorylase